MTDIPKELADFLNEAGIGHQPKKKIEKRPMTTEVAWKPSFKGEEPPF